jgi:SAM-dependent methyltransferase
MTAEFDRLAAEYEKLLEDPLRDYFAPGSDFFVTRKLDMLLGFAGARGLDTSKMTWLDVGCGKGQLLRAGRPHFARVVGCDVSSAMFEGCRDLDVTEQIDPDRLPFEDASVDWVTAVCVYHHVDPAARSRLTIEIRRVLKPAGVFAIIEHNPLNPVVQMIVRRTPVDEHAILLTARSARRLMTDAGLEAVDTRYFLYLPQWLYRRGRLLEKSFEKVPLGGQYAAFGINPAPFA